MSVIEGGQGGDGLAVGGEGRQQVGSEGRPASEKDEEGRRGRLNRTQRRWTHDTQRRGSCTPPPRYP
jgi:hypothetical protein